jgi:hypothetical protein
MQFVADSMKRMQEDLLAQGRELKLAEIRADVEIEKSKSSPRFGIRRPLPSGR